MEPVGRYLLRSKSLGAGSDADTGEWSRLERSSDPSHYPAGRPWPSMVQFETAPESPPAHAGGVRAPVRLVRTFGETDPMTKEKAHFHGHRQRLRHRFLKSG